MTIDDLASWTVELNGWDDVNTLEHHCGYSHEVAPSAPLADLLVLARTHVCEATPAPPETRVSQQTQVD